MIKLHHGSVTDWVGTELESDDIWELELDRSSKTQRGTQQPLLTFVLSVHYRTTNWMGTKWNPPNKQYSPLKQYHLRAVSTPRPRAISPAAQTDCKSGNSTPSTAPGQHEEIPFNRWNKNIVSPAKWNSFMFGIGLDSQDNRHLSLSLLKGGGQAASQLSHLEGKQLRCCEAPNQRGATSCLQGARSFKFPDGNLQQWKSFRISEYVKIKNPKAVKREINRSQRQMRWGKKGCKRSPILWIIEMSWLISVSLNLNYIMDSLSNETPNVL